MMDKDFMVVVLNDLVTLTKAALNDDNIETAMAVLRQHQNALPQIVDALTKMK